MSYLNFVRFMQVHVLEYHGDPSTLRVPDPVDALLIVRVRGSSKSGWGQSTVGAADQNITTWNKQGSKYITIEAPIFDTI